ncbi:MAG: D-alanine--D-alanine ligase family protein [Bacteroidales bacterium]
MKKKIALIYGGDSSEFEVSVKSGKHIALHIDREKYDVWEVLMKGQEWRVLACEDGSQLVGGHASYSLDKTFSYPIDKADFSFVIPSDLGIGGTRVHFDIALIMIHGTPGENGLLQAYFELIGMPFTTSPATVCALSFNKYACKCMLRDTGVKLAREIFLRRADNYNPFQIIAKLGLPLFVKPNNGGSSFGISKVKRAEELSQAIENAFKEDDAILIEEFIEGREMTNGVFENGVITANGDRFENKLDSNISSVSGAKSYNNLIDRELYRLPVTEIIPDNEFFDYEAKYLGASQEICPAAISEELSDRIIDLSHKIFHHLGCKGFVRIDYIVRGDEIFFLEVNSVPGMTEMSLVPQQIRAAGLTIKEFLNHLLSQSF